MVTDICQYALRVEGDVVDLLKPRFVVSSQTKEIF